MGTELNKENARTPGSRLGRRDFCVGAAASVVLASGCRDEQQQDPDAGPLPSANPPTGLSLQSFGSGASRVVEVRWAAAVDANGKVHEPSVRTMLEAAMNSLAGGSDLWADWARSRVSIKVNSITSQAHTHPELAGAMAASLIKAGAQASRVTVWDKHQFGLEDRGYTIDKTGQGGRYRCLGSDSLTKAANPRSAVLPCKHKVTFSPLLSEADVLISVAALKDHSMAGVTLSLKNNFGMIHEAENLHGVVKQGAACEPGISQLAAQPQIKGKLKLAAIDALVGVCEGGPGTAAQQHAFRYAGILVSRDPVALDRRGLAIIEQRRARLGLVPLARRTSPNPSPPKHIENAAKLGVGS